MTYLTELCNKVILGAANNTQVQVNSIKRSIKDTDWRELAEMLKSPSCPTETTEDVLNYYKSNRDKININVLEAIFNNTINSDKIIENAFKLYIYYYNSYRDNRYSKVILNHSRFTQEMYINLTKYLIKNKLGSFLHEFIKHKYCTKDLYVEAVCTNTFNSDETNNLPNLYAYFRHKFNKSITFSFNLSIALLLSFIFELLFFFSLF